MSNLISSNYIGTFANDFSVLTNTYKMPGSATDAVVQLPGSIAYGLWPGDADNNGTIDMTDVNAVKIAVAASASGYLPTDINLSGGINATDMNLVKKIIAASGSGGVPTRAAVRKIRTSLPDPIVE